MFNRQTSHFDLMPAEVSPTIPVDIATRAKRLGKKALFGVFYGAAIIGPAIAAVTAEHPDALNNEEATRVLYLGDQSSIQQASYHEKSAPNNDLTFVIDGFGSYWPREYSYDLSCTIRSIDQGKVAAVFHAGYDQFDSILTEAKDLIDKEKPQKVKIHGVSAGGIFATKLAAELIKMGVDVSEIQMVTTPVVPENVPESQTWFAQKLAEPTLEHAGYIGRYMWRMYDVITKDGKTSLQEKHNWASSAAQTPKNVLYNQYKMVQGGVSDKDMEVLAKNGVIINYITTKKAEQDPDIDTIAAIKEITDKYVKAGGDEGNVRSYSLLDGHASVTRNEPEIYETWAKMTGNDPNSIIDIDRLAISSIGTVCEGSARDVLREMQKIYVRQS